MHVIGLVGFSDDDGPERCRLRIARAGRCERVEASPRDALVHEADHVDALPTMAFAIVEGAGR